MPYKRLTYLQIALMFYAIFISSPVVMAEDAKFIYPADKTVIFVSTVRVIGNAGNKSTVTLSVENTE